MLEKSFQIKDSFLTVSGKLIVICQEPEENFPEVKIGDSAKIIRPDKTVTKTEINGVNDFSKQCFSEKSFLTIGFLLDDLSESDVPDDSRISFVT